MTKRHQKVTGTEQNFPINIMVKRQYVHVFVEIVSVFHNGGHYDPIVEAILFGSYARGDAEPGSDIDVLILVAFSELNSYCAEPWLL